MFFYLYSTKLTLFLLFMRGTRGYGVLESVGTSAKRCAWVLFIGQQIIDKFTGVVAKNTSSLGKTLGN